MRLMMILPHLGVGGAQRVAVTLANYWVQQGIDVHVVTTLEHKEDFYELSPLVKRAILEKLRRPNIESLVNQPDGPLAMARARWRVARARFTAAWDYLRACARVAVPDRPPGSDQRGLAPHPAFIGPLAVSVFSGLVTLLAVALELARGAVRLVRHAVGSLLKLGSRASRSCMDKRALGRSPQLYLALMRISMWRVPALRRLLQNAKPDVVLSFLGATNIITIASARGLPLRLVISERNDPARQELDEPWQSLRPLMYPMADIVTANSHGAITEMRDFCSAGKLAYVPNPVVIPAECRRRRKNAVLFLARLVPQKGPDVLIDAFARFVQSNPGWSLQIAGDGPMERELIERVRDYGIAESVVFHGMVKDPTELLALSRVFVLPSRFEGTPNSLLEAMTARLACIVTDASPGPLTLIEHGVTGLVVKTDDAEGLAEALTTLARDAAWRRKLGRAAAERTSDFRLENVIEDWERLLFPH